MSADQASRSSARLLLQGLPPRTQIAIDAHSEAYLTNEHFAGIKNLPPGWHCISWSIPASDQSGSGPSESSNRSVLLRYFEESETAIRELDRVQQRLVEPEPSSGVGRSRRRRATRTIDSSSSSSTIVSPEVISSVESRLLPYPTAAEEAWRNATRHLSIEGGRVGRQVVAKVLGVDVSNGDSTSDSFAAGPSRIEDGKEEVKLQRTGNLGRNEKGKVIWGKSRPSPERFEVDVDEDSNPAESKSRKRPSTPDDDTEDEALQFTLFDLRRSWPSDSIGSEITRWSQDKSWLLQDVARRSCNNFASSGTPWYLALLCELELAFILFITANNVYAFDQWKQIVELFCRSTSIIGASSEFALHPSTVPSASTESSPVVDAHIAFLTTLRAQLQLLADDFWTSQSSPREESALLKNLDVLRASVARSLSSSAIATNQNATEEKEREQLVRAWRSLSHSTARFGWDLDRRLDEEAEVQDDLLAEEGEDAPVIVDL